MYTIWLKSFLGVWEAVGADRLAGIWAEDLTPAADEHGPSTFTFTLKRDPNAQVFPDLKSKTPCRIEYNGKQVWAGSVWETPTRTGSDRQISVTAKGLQANLDDSTIDGPEIITNMEGFVDIRSILAAPLNLYKSEPQVEVSAGVVSMGWANGSTAVTSDFCGIVYDLGKPYQIESLALDLSIVTGQSDISVYVQLSNQYDAFTSGPYLNLQSGTAMTNIATDPSFTSWVYPVGYSERPYRYLQIKMGYSGGGGTFGGERIMKIRRFQLALRSWDIDLTNDIKVAPRSSGRKSVLRASDIAGEVARVGFLDGNKNAESSYKTNIVDNIKSQNFIDEVKSTPDIAGAWTLDGANLAAAAVDQSGNGLTLIESTAGGGASPTYNQTGLLDSETSQSVLFASGAKCLGSTSVPAGLARNSAIEVVFKTPTLPATTTAGDGICVAQAGNKAADGYGIWIGSNANTNGNGTYWKILVCGVAWITTGVTAASNTTYHVVLSNDVFGVFRMYVNGALIYTSTARATIAPTTFVSVGGCYDSTSASSITNTSAITVDSWALHNNAISGPLAYIHYRAALNKNKTSKIQRTSFNIEEYAPSAANTGRERLEAANAFHDWLWKFDNNDDLVYKPRPSTPLLEIGNWSGATFEDSSLNSVEDLYNWVRVTGPLAPWNFDSANPNAGIQPGAEFSLDRHAGQMLATGKVPGAAPFVDYREPNTYLGSGLEQNPSFAVNTTGWTGLYGSTLTRDTTVFDTTPASLKVANATANLPAAVSVGFGEYNQGETMLFTFRMKSGSTTAPTYVQIQIRSAYNPQDTINHYAVLPPNQWVTVTAPFVPNSMLGPSPDGTELGLQLGYIEIWSHAANQSFYIDSVTKGRERSTLLDRLKTVRKKEFQTGTMLTIPAMQQVADTALTRGWTPPLKGTVTVTEDGGVRLMKGGAPVPVAELLNYGGEKILFSNLIDPTTGALGRIGTIAEVTVDADQKSASIAIDNSRTSFEALLARLALVAGQVR